MSFLAPLFLLGLAALAVPILIHLTHRERRDPVVFPSLMFLRKIPYRSERRQRIRHWLLFLLRATAVILVAAAFARPLVSGAGAGGGPGSARHAVVLLDRSYSMGYGDRWSRAKAAAGRAIDALGPDDRATVVFFADRAEAASQATADRAALHAIVDAVAPGDGTTRYGPALQLARDLLAASTLPRREVILITDFQRIGWEGREDVRMPAGTRITPVDLSDADPSNLAVSGVLLERATGAGPGRVTVSARVAATARDAGRTARVVLEMSGEAARSATVAVPQGGAAVARFAAVPLPDRVVGGRVRLADADRLPRDDAFHFVLLPPTTVDVLVVEHPSSRPDEGLYLRRALGIGRDPSFRVTVSREGRLGARDLEGRDFVVVNDAPVYGGGSAEALRRFVTGGGGLLLVLAERTAPGAAAAVFPELLAAASSAPVDRFGDRGGSASVVDYHHPAFVPFAAPRSGDFSAARFFRYRRLATAPGASVLMRFDDGASALAEAAVDSGRVMVWASDLANSWNDLPVQPVFLPFVHRVARHLARYVETPAWRAVGQAIDLAGLASAAATTAAGGQVVIEAPSGARSAHPLRGPDARVVLHEAGFYHLRAPNDARDLAVIAVNPDISESDLARVDPDEVIAAASPRSAAAAAPGSGEVLGPVELERRQGLWWYLLMAALVLLAAETVVAGRVAPTVRRPDA